MLLRYLARKPWEFAEFRPAKPAIPQGFSLS